MIPNLETEAAKLAAWIGAVLVSIAGAVKWFFLVRRDSRGDGAEASQSQVYRDIIAQQGEQIDRLGSRLEMAERRSDVLEGRIKIIGQRVTDEINERYKAENEARQALGMVGALKARVADLEVENRNIKLQRGDMP